MPADLYLIAPPTDDAETLVRQLRGAFDAARIAALLVPRAGRDDMAYRAAVEAALPWAQGAGCAVLVEDDAELAKSVGADGVHVTGDAEAVRHAVAAVRPALIVGATIAGASRHDAMIKGELDVDYIMFGPISGAIEEATRELAQWWAETMEVPSVLSDPQANAAAVRSERCEFLAVGENVWQAAEGAPAALRAIAARLDD